jgi:hypothetical protein
VIRSTGPPAWQKLPGSGPGKAWTWKDLDLPSQLLGLLSDPRSDPAERQRLIRTVRQQYLDPLRNHLKGVRRLLVVPCWPLEALPLEVLAEERRVSYVPSASLFARFMERHRPLGGSSLLAVGDPVFTPGKQPAPPPPDGVLLVAVLRGGDADRAGLRAGDVLLSLGGARLDGPADLRKALASVPAPLVYWRDGTRHAVRLEGARLNVRVDGRAADVAVRDWRNLNAAQVVRGRPHLALPGTRKEVMSLARLVPQTTLLLGSAASEQNLAQLASSGKLRTFRLLHLATHGEVNAADPKQSALILSQDRLPSRPTEAVLRGEKPIDGRLTVGTILGKWELDADLVVLSACQTGLGLEAGGEGLLGFAQALLQKGARGVVLSRWKVDDRATALLMVRFYENLLGKRAGLKQPLPRAEALSEAKKWLSTLPRRDTERLVARLEGGQLRGSVDEPLPVVKGRLAKLPEGERPFAHPYYWAAFVLIGDPS